MPIPTDQNPMNAVPADETALLELGSASEETRGRIMQPLEFGVSPTSRDEAG